MKKNLSSKIYTYRIIAFTSVFSILSVFGYELSKQFFFHRTTELIQISAYLIFCILFTLLSYGSSIAIFGFIKRLGKGDLYSIDSHYDETVSINKVPVAILIPIYNESVSFVFSRVAAMFRSLIEQSSSGGFDFFILSDTTNEEIWLQEELAYLQVCNELNCFDRVFYRKRKSNLNAKSGNIADFCRRWGKKYRYMIVLDADSLMTGQSFIRMVQLMETNPNVGIIQTSPKIINAETFLQKMIYYSSFVGSQLFLSGANYWQMSSGPFWGHNAIIRMEPFMQYCGLPSLPKFGALGGRILSHDTIEVALLRKAGYSVWMAYQIEGSYEEHPPTLQDTLKRDKRWCNGNLQHFWFLLGGGIRTTNRIHILLGIMSYFSSLLWFCFIILLSILYIDDQEFFRLSQGDQWESIYNETVGKKFLALQYYTIVILFLPRILVLLNIFIHKDYYQNRINYSLKYLLETLVSSILAPVFMLFYTKFVIEAVLGFKVIWSPQKRNIDSSSIISSIHQFGWISFIGMLCGLCLYFYSEGLFYWLTPIWLSWLLSVPISYFLSQKNSEKVHDKTSLNILTLQTDYETKISENINKDIVKKFPMVFLLLYVPFYYAVHSSFQKQKDISQKRTNKVNSLLDRAIRNGWASLSKQEKIVILHNIKIIHLFSIRMQEYPNDAINTYWKELNNQFLLYTSPIRM